MAGSTLAFIMTYKSLLLDLDKLGKEYELSMIVKQDIFDVHPELNPSQRAQIYMK